MKRRVVHPVLFRTNYYTIEIPHGVTAISLTYHPHHAKLQVLPKPIDVPREHIIKKIIKILNGMIEVFASKVVRVSVHQHLVHEYIHTEECWKT